MSREELQREINEPQFCYNCKYEKGDCGEGADMEGCPCDKEDCKCYICLHSVDQWTPKEETP